MKSIKYEGTTVEPTIFKPWLLAVQGHGTNSLFGWAFLMGKVNGCACSESFETIPLDKLADGAYFVDASPVPKDRLDMLQYNGPVIDTKLPELTFSHLHRDYTFKDMVEVINHPLTLDKFTAISVDVYVQILRVLGARIGRVKDAKIVWEKQLLFPETIRPN